METKLTMDQAGRVALPKAVRDELRLAAGDTLDVRLTSEELTLRPRRNATPLQKERGVWVLRTGVPLRAEQVEDTLRGIRMERRKKNSSALPRAAAREGRDEGPSRHLRARGYILCGP
jgi:AbrB family looped-hinge helix DNA binding protein